MATAEQVLGLTGKPKAEELLGLTGYQPTPITSIVTEPPPFDVDDYLANYALTGLPPEDIYRKKQSFSETIAPLTRPFVAQGYNTMSAINRSFATITHHADLIDKWATDKFGMKSLIPWGEIADYYEKDSEKWKKRAEEVGINFVDELISEAVGGAPYGVAEFMLGVPWAGILGASKAHEQGQNELVGALLEGAKRYSLGMIFKAIHPLRQYLRAPTMGGVFGIQAATEGADMKDITKAVFTGALYSMTSPGGQMGLNEIIPRTPKELSLRFKLAEAKAELKKEATERLIEQERVGGALSPEEAIRQRQAGEWDDYLLTKKNVKEDGYGHGTIFIVEEFPGDKITVFKAVPKDVNEIMPGDYVTASKLYAEEHLQGHLTGKLVENPELVKGGKIISAEIPKNDLGVAAANELIWVPKTETALKKIRKGYEEKLKETEFEARPPIEEIGKEFKEGEPIPVERSGLKTAETAEGIHPRLREIIKDIQEEEIQNYYRQTNPESIAKANKRIEASIDEAINYVRSDAPMNAEKGGTFVALIDRFQREGDFGRALEMVEAYDFQMREAGRFNQIYSLLVRGRLTPVSIIKWAEREIEKANKNYGRLDTLFGRKPGKLTEEDRIDIVRRQTEILKMPDGIEKADATLKLMDFVAQKVPPSISEYIDAYRYQNMLAGPRTQMRNIGENIFNTFVTRPWDITTRGAVDWVKSAHSGKEREYWVRDVADYYKNAINAIPNASNAFMEVMRGKTVLRKPELGIEGEGEFQAARTRQLPDYLTLVSRFMEASDRFNSSLIASGEYAVGLKKGLSEGEAYSQAQKTAERYLYRERLKLKSEDLSYFSQILAGLADFADKGRRQPGLLGKSLSWFVPFIRTPINKGIAMIEHSPLALARGQFGQEAIARISTGSIMVGVGAGFALWGDTTWAPPSSEEEKQWFYATGRKPFSVRIGNYWIPMWYLGPFALSFGIPAAIRYYASDSKTSLLKDSQEKIFDIASGLGKFLASQTSVQGLGNFLNLIEGDIDYSLANNLGFMFGQAIPAQSFIRYVNTIVDPVYRKPDGFWENIQKDIPWWSKELPSRKTPFLVESEREFFNYFLPYDVGKLKEEYEGLYPVIEMEKRINYLDNKMNDVLDKMANDEIKMEKGIDKINNILEAYPKAMKIK